MENLSFNDYSHTQLGYNNTLYSNKRTVESCEHCKYNNKSFKERWAWLRTFHRNNIPVPECNCPIDGATYYVATLLRARGNPVKTKPENTIYVITIWTINRPTRAECNSDALFEENPNYEIVLDFAEDPRDLSHDNKSIIIGYFDYLSNITESRSTFKGKSPRASYIKDFIKRITNIKNTKERTNDVSEDNAHIKRRQKGHSHIK